MRRRPYLSLSRAYSAPGPDHFRLYFRSPVLYRCLTRLNLAGVLRRLLADLHRKGVVTEDLCLPDDFDDLELVYRGLCRRNSRSLRRRIGTSALRLHPRLNCSEFRAACSSRLRSASPDFLTIPWTSRGAALLYYTGDDVVSRYRYSCSPVLTGLNVHPHLVSHPPNAILNRRPIATTPRPLPALVPACSSTDRSA